MESLADLGSIAKALPSGLRGVEPKIGSAVAERILRDRAGKTAAKHIAQGRQQPAERAIARGRRYKDEHRQWYRDYHGSSEPEFSTKMRVQRQKDLGMPYPKEHEGSWWLK